MENYINTLKKALLILLGVLAFFGIAAKSDRRQVQETKSSKQIEQENREANFLETFGYSNFNELTESDDAKYGFLNTDIVYYSPMVASDGTEYIIVAFDNDRIADKSNIANAAFKMSVALRDLEKEKNYKKKEKEDEYKLIVLTDVERYQGVWWNLAITNDYTLKMFIDDMVTPNDSQMKIINEVREKIKKGEN